MVCGVTIHIIALPYADMTLLAANASLAIIGNLILSIYLFEEKWVWKFDCTAMALIIGGCCSIVLLSNKEQIDYNGQQLLDKLTAWPAIAFYLFVSVFMGVTCYVMYAFESALRTFESDAELHDHRLRVESGDQAESRLMMVFPPKAKSDQTAASSANGRNEQDTEIDGEINPADGGLG